MSIIRIDEMRLLIKRLSRVLENQRVEMKPDHERDDEDDCRERTCPDYYTDDFIKSLLLLGRTRALNTFVKQSTSPSKDNEDITGSPLASSSRIIGRVHIRIPRGTILLVNLWAIQNDPNIGKDPTRFDPERFKGWELGTGKRGVQVHAVWGRRRCPGDGLAMRVVGLVLGSLIQCFVWERIGEETVDMSEGVGVTLHKASRLQTKCRPRPALEKILQTIRCINRI
ncbi:LOW QUALITY PROTEIN: Cytochrome P450, partial [Dillenia turbinata]